MSAESLEPLAEQTIKVEEEIIVSSPEKTTTGESTSDGPQGQDGSKERVSENHSATTSSSGQPESSTTKEPDTVETSGATTRDPSQILSTSKLTTLTLMARHTQEWTVLGRCRDSVGRKKLQSLKCIQQDFTKTARSFSKTFARKGSASQSFETEASLP